MAIVPDPFECAVHPDRDIVRVELTGELDIATAPQAARAIQELIDVGFPSVTVDLARLTFIDSTGLHMLLEASRAAAARGCALTLVPGPYEVQRAFEITNVESHFTFETPRRTPRRTDRFRSRASDAVVRDWLRHL